MRNIFPLIFSVLAFSFSFTASAFEADFAAKIKDLSTENNDIRIISNAHFTNTEIQNNGSFTISFSVIEGIEDPIFTGSATIDASDTFVKVGTRNNGKITIKHDLETGEIKARFVKKVTVNGDDPNANYQITATTGSWSGAAAVSSAVESQEIIYPEQITILSNATVEFGVVQSMTVTIAGNVVFSGPYSNSVTVDTLLEDNSNLEIIISFQGENDGIPLYGDAIRLLQENITTYDAGTISLYPQPQ